MCQWVVPSRLKAYEKENGKKKRKKKKVVLKEGQEIDDWATSSLFHFGGQWQIWNIVAFRN